MHSPQSTPVTHRGVLAIAVPIMLSNVTEPMIGVVNSAVIGQLPGAYYIGAITVGALIFNFIYWGFGFLRLGTGGLSAQATGSGDAEELVAVLMRALLIAVIAYRRLREMGARFESFRVFDRAKLIRTLAINRDIMIRTVCLVLVFSWFTARGAKASDVIVSANAILMHFFDVAAFLIDGFAF